MFGVLCHACPVLPVTVCRQIGQRSQSARGRLGGKSPFLAPTASASAGDDKEGGCPHPAPFLSVSLLPLLSLLSLPPFLFVCAGMCEITCVDVLLSVRAPALSCLSALPDDSLSALDMALGIGGDTPKGGQGRLQNVS